MKIKLDVLLPFHRIDKYFYEALNSLKKSTVPLRVIMINDSVNQNFRLNLHSTTNLWLTYCNTGGNIGYGNALKIGTNYIENPFVALMNSDDLIHPDRFKKQLEIINEFDIVISNLRKIGSNLLREAENFAQKENCIDMARAGRQHRQKLSINDVIDIRNKFQTGKYSKKDLAIIYGVTSENIRSIVYRLSWKHI